LKLTGFLAAGRQQRKDAVHTAKYLVGKRLSDQLLFCSNQIFF
jgi:hypothetical protein